MIVSPEGRPVSYRRAIVPGREFLDGCSMQVLTCAVFFRRRVWENGLTFNPAYKIVSDTEWMARLLLGKVKIATISEPLSVFTWSTDNLSRLPLADSESKAMRATLPPPGKISRPFRKLLSRAKKWRAKAVFPMRVDYGMYLPASFSRRTFFSDNRLPQRWPQRN